MPDHSAIERIPIDIELPSPAQQPPLAMTYCDKHGRSLSVVYPQSQQPPVAHYKAVEYDPLKVAIVWFLLAIGLALPITAVAMVFEAMNPTVEVQNYGH
ncbi:MAG: hypothetical protein AAF215_05335 [Cyanobacteria bacterium P01_A01_bin.123]